MLPCRSKLRIKSYTRKPRSASKKRRVFSPHLLTYIVVNAGLFFIWLMTDSGGYPWFIWPIFGWGIGLIFHFLGIFVFTRPSDWERREIEKEMERLKKR